MAEPQTIALTSAILLDALKSGRRRGTITVNNPIRASALCAALLRFKQVQTTPRELRATVNMLADAGECVCSVNRGYYYAATYDEMTPAIEYYSSYISEYTRRRAAMMRSRERLRDPDQDMFGHPVVVANNKEFRL